MHTCTVFTNFTAWLSRGLERNDPDLTGTERPANMSKQQWSCFQREKNRHGDSTSSNSAGGTDEAQLEKMQDIIGKCELNFGRNLQILLDALNYYAATETVVLLGLCARLSTANQGTESSGLRTDDQAGVWLLAHFVMLGSFDIISTRVWRRPNGVKLALINRLDLSRTHKLYNTISASPALNSSCPQPPPLSK